MDGVTDEEFRQESAKSLNCEPGEVVIYETKDVEFDDELITEIYLVKKT
jgi:hypothetical protein